MPIVFSVAVKPTPSIAAEQRSVDIRNGEERLLSVHGRHDPCIVHRASHVVNACTALALLDIITTRDGNAPRNTKI
jgi:chorismate synthase